MRFPLIWIPLLPLLGAAINLLIGRKLPRRAVHTLAIGSVLGALLVTLFAVFGDLFPMWKAGAHGAASPKLYQTVFDWIVAGNVSIKLGLMCDTLTAVMLLTITFVGFLIHVYSSGYMSHDPDAARFFGYLNLFTGAMLMLVLGDNLVVLFVGWEGVGLCSYLLIGFWYDKSGTQKLGIENANAGKKAFIVNRIGDVAFILGMFILFAAVGSLDFDKLAANPQALLHGYKPLGLGSVTIAGAAALLLFIGATGKSAQIPLFVWLPDAMAGPTPVSALIHAATMVTAGVYMVARMNFLYMLTPAVMGLIALVGALTALFAATIGLAQNDIKKVLAYSTVSQLGYMFMGVGMGAFSAGIFHVFTHAFFKACLFLGAGAVIHALHDEQDIRRMGGLKSQLPITRWTFLVSTLAIAGIPIFSGFFSKDEILWKAISTGNPAWGPSWFPMLIYVLGMAGAMCTAFYMFRLYALTFHGDCRLSAEEQAKIHPPGPAMAMPLVVLAVGAAILGLLGLPGLLDGVFGGHANFFHAWLAPVVDQGAIIAAKLNLASGYVSPNALAHSHTLEGGLMLLSTVIAAGMSFLGFRMYQKGPSRWAADFAARWSTLYQLVYHKYLVDEIYFGIIIWPFKKLAWLLWRLVDFVFIDLLAVNIVGGKLVDTLGRLARRLQTGNIQHYVVALLVGLVAILYYVSTPPAQFKVHGVDKKKGWAEPGQRVVFDASREVRSDQRHLEYRWDFDGDGTWDLPKTKDDHGHTLWSPSATAGHVFQRPGRYRVILKVRDKRWHTTSRKTITLQVGDPKARRKQKAKAHGAKHAASTPGHAGHGKGAH
ncbi:MAG: NADH-quinone oxidoreductase subunit L [Proteobacteria bacterium]|nr:MAG: NADH-quinone oxidoreductase subunit L [Pseudomonadota bacterium]